MEEEQSKKKSELSKFLNIKIQNTAVLSVLRFRKTVENKTTKPEVNDALQFISKIDENWSGKFHRNFQTKEITFRKSKNYLFFALIEKDPKNLIEELCHVITKNNIDKKTSFVFTQAHRNLWNNEGSTELEFHNIPDWRSEEEAGSFYGLFGEGAELKSYGGCDVVRFRKINTYLVLRWHSQNLSNKTGIFKVDDDYSITAKFTSKVQCGTCCGYGHQTAACPEGVLPLLEKLKKSKPSSSESKVVPVQHRKFIVDNAHSPKTSMIGPQVEKTTQNNNKPTKGSKELAAKEKKGTNKDKEQKKEQETKCKEKDQKKTKGTTDELFGKKKKENKENSGPKHTKMKTMQFDEDDEEYEEESHFVDSEDE